jgi:hypothetical protein
VVGFVAFNKNLEYRSNFGGTISAVLLGIAFRQSENPECENLNEKRGPRSPEKFMHCYLGSMHHGRLNYTTITNGSTERC